MMYDMGESMHNDVKGKFIIRDDTPCKPIPKRLTLEQRLFWVYAYAVSRQHPKKYYEEEQSVAAGKFNQVRSVISDWQKKLVAIGVATWKRHDKVGPDGYRLKNILKITRPPDEVYQGIREDLGRLGNLLKFGESRMSESDMDEVIENKGELGTTPQKVTMSESDILTTSTSHVPTANIPQLIASSEMSDSDIKMSDSDMDHAAENKSDPREHRGKFDEKVDQIERSLRSAREKLERWNKVTPDLKRPDLEKRVSDLEDELRATGGGQ
jgi:hypothetical protein